MTSPTLLPAGREPCTRCDAAGRVAPDNRRCPVCRGRGYEPHRRGPRPSAEEAAPYLEQLQRLGDLREEWRDPRGDKAQQIRNGIYDDIRAVARQARAIHVPIYDIAQALGVSETHFGNIMRGDPTGKRR